MNDKQHLTFRIGRTGLAAVALIVSAGLLVGCGEKKGDQASQTAAKVNKEEITVHQINFLLQRQAGLKPEQMEEASRQVLERLIDQELTVQKAQELKVDRDPRVVAQIEAAKREIISRAYIERVGDSVSKPTADEVSKFYNEKPALFKERRIYSLQELAVEANPELAASLKERLQNAKNLNEFIDYLKANDIRFNGNQAVRAAEQLPLSSLDTIARMKDGDTAVQITPTGLQLLHVAGSRSQPVEEAKARPAIEAFLTNQRKAEAVQKDVKALREAGKVEYIGKFAQAAASAPAAAAATQLAEPPSTAASGLDAGTISKGMGLK